MERNEGASDIDGMETTVLLECILENGSTILATVRTNSYLPQRILGVNIPKGQGKTWLLGIPTVIDRWLQQAVSQQKNIHKAVLRTQGYLNAGYQDIVDIDLQGMMK